MLIRALGCASAVICLGAAAGHSLAQTPDLDCGLSIPCRLPSTRLARALAKEVNFSGFDDPQTTLLDALGTLANTHDVTFDICELAFKAEGLKDLLTFKIAEKPLPKMERAPLEAVVRAILARLPVGSGATCILERDLILITTKAHAALHSWAELKSEGRQFVNQSRYLAESFLSTVVPGDIERTRDVAALALLTAHWHTVLVENAGGIQKARFDSGGLRWLKRSCGFRP
jgi:hypothetical protein